MNNYTYEIMFSIYITIINFGLIIWFIRFMKVNNQKDNPED